ncbi:DUF2946 family protein [Sphingomonas carotinifaciens]|uniref:DUF2946 family protein n=1 Tax=Sphingomonas carotinifaciens TaxID=1166323 RepID=UPI0039A0251D
MIAVRHLLAQRRLAVLICAAALLLKLLVPTGYMIGNDHGALGIVICSGAAPMMTMPAGDGAMAAMHDTAPEQGPSKEHGKAEMPCAYAGLSAQMLGAVDPIVLVAALAVVAALALLPAPRRVHRSAHHLRPPLRGPPLPRD